MSVETIKELVQRLGVTVTERTHLQKDRLDESVNHNCKKCHDVGWVAVLADGRQVPMDSSEVVGTSFNARECKCQQAERVERLFESSHITDAFRAVGLKDFKTDGRPQCVKDAKEAVTEYWHSFGKIRSNRTNSIALLGEPGSGKTHLLTALCNNFLAKGISVLYFPWIDGMNELKSDWDGLDARLNLMNNVEVLYIDDLFKGRVKPKEFALEQIFGVVNYRYNKHLPIIVSSEWGFDAIRGLDRAFGGRLWEMTKDYAVIMALTAEERTQGMELDYRTL